MAGYEQQLEDIVGKAKMHEYIDSLPEGARMVVLVDDGETYRCAMLGDLSAQEALWMLRGFELDVLFKKRTP